MPQAPSFLGATDAAKAGMGGIFYDGEGRPFVWRYPFPGSVQDRQVTANNPRGDLTNSDLEQVAILAQLHLIGDAPGSAYSTVHIFSDNTPAVSPFQKGAVASDGIPADLCRAAGLHQRRHRYCPVVSFLNGPENVMADDASRLQHLSHTAFLAHFNQRYPQDGPWTLLQLSSSASSRILSALLSPSQGKAASP